MGKDERQQSLISARRGAQWLSAHVMPLLDIEEMRNNVQCLIDEFRRLDIGEQKRNEAGRTFGKLGKDSATLPPKPGKQRRGRPRQNKQGDGSHSYRMGDYEIIQMADDRWHIYLEGKDTARDFPTLREARRVLYNELSGRPRKESE